MRNPSSQSNALKTILAGEPQTIPGRDPFQRRQEARLDTMSTPYDAHAVLISFLFRFKHQPIAACAFLQQPVGSSRVLVQPWPHRPLSEWVGSDSDGNIGINKRALNTSILP